MAATPSRKAHVTDDATNPATGNEYPGTVRPYLVELGQERIVIFNVSELALACLVLL
jgi:hypothetical protein